MLTSIYLIANAIGYLIFGILCTVKFQTSANFLGLDFLNNSGKAEYAAIYIGMEFGFAAFYGMCAYFPSMKLPGLIFSVALYGGLVLARTISALHFGQLQKATFMAGAFEYIFLIWGMIALMCELKTAAL